MLDNPIVCKTGHHFAVWMYLLLNATHAEQNKVFGGEKITLKPGQLITGRKKIAEFLKGKSTKAISESKVERIISDFIDEHQIEQQTCTKNRLITILNWDLYQSSEQQFEQLTNNKRTASEQQTDTNNNERMKEGNNKTPSNIYLSLSREGREEYQRQATSFPRSLDIAPSE